MVDSRDALNSLLYNFSKLNKIKTNKEYKIVKQNLKNLTNQIINTSLYFQYFDQELIQNINLRRSYYLDIAASLAKSSTMFQKHGAILVNKRNIIGKGCNIYSKKSNTNYSMHAEIMTINNAIKTKTKEILANSEMYVVRISTCEKKNILKYSKPCFNCQKYINKFKINKVYYSTNYDFDNYIKN